MGRQEKRERVRIAKNLHKRLGRDPNEEEIEAALRQLEKTRRKEGRSRNDHQKKG